MCDLNDEVILRKTQGGTQFDKACTAGALKATSFRNHHNTFYMPFAKCKVR